MADVQIFNDLPSVDVANERLRSQLLKMGEKADLSGLKEIFDRHGVSEWLGLALLHNHYHLAPGERVVEYGHVSTPWPVPDTGRVSGGQAVPRAWIFKDSDIVPYEYGFNHPGEEEYTTQQAPSAFVREANEYLVDNDLDSLLGLILIGEAELEGRVERTVGRVSITVPFSAMDHDSDGELETDEEAEGGPAGHISAVWSFNCKAGLQSTSMKSARNCLWCPKGQC